jgi:hypothetical protein
VGKNAPTGKREQEELRGQRRAHNIEYADISGRYELWISSLNIRNIEGISVTEKNKKL